MTIAEKLASIKASKDAIKQAIETKGVACGDVLSEYAEKIADIPTGGIDMRLGIKFAYSTFTTEQFEALNTYNWDKVTNATTMFYACRSLTTVSALDTSNVTYMTQTFSQCTNLLEISQLDTGKVINMDSTFYGCASLTSISQLDTSNVTNMNGIFFGCAKLTDLGGFKNLSVSLSLSDSPLLTIESLMNVINNLKDLTGGTAQTLTLGSTNLAKLTDEQKAVATGKNWVLA